jgi:hypothetical protein
VDPIPIQGRRLWKKDEINNPGNKSVSKGADPQEIGRELGWLAVSHHTGCGRAR